MNRSRFQVHAKARPGMTKHIAPGFRDNSTNKRAPQFVITIAQNFR
jgi:hypothetical protein